MCVSPPLIGAFCRIEVGRHVRRHVVPALQLLPRPLTASAALSVAVAIGPPLHLIRVVRDTEELTTVLVNFLAFHLEVELTHRKLPHLKHVVEAVALGIQLVLCVHVMAPLQILRALLFRLAALDAVAILNLVEAQVDALVQF